MKCLWLWRDLRGERAVADQETFTKVGSWVKNKKNSIISKKSQQVQEKIVDSNGV